MCGILGGELPVEDDKKRQRKIDEGEGSASGERAPGGGGKGVVGSAVGGECGGGKRQIGRLRQTGNSGDLA